MTPIVDGLEAEFEGRVAVVRLDAADPEVVAVQAGYGQRGHPSFVVLDADGQIVASFIGTSPAETLREALNQALSVSSE
jgi:thioredoxin-like negative regulator of GroEL